MPEFPDIEAYISALRRTVRGHTIRRVRLKSIFLVRSIDPPALRLSYLKSLRYTGFALVDKINPLESVIDVGCGLNLLKEHIAGLVGIDPVYPEAD